MRNQKKASTFTVLWGVLIKQKVIFFAVVNEYFIIRYSVEYWKYFLRLMSQSVLHTFYSLTSVLRIIPVLGKEWLHFDDPSLCKMNVLMFLCCSVDGVFHRTWTELSFCFLLDGGNTRTLQPTHPPLPLDNILFSRMTLQPFVCVQVKCKQINQELSCSVCKMALFAQWLYTPAATAATVPLKLTGHKSFLESIYYSVKINSQWGSPLYLLRIKTMPHMSW